ncbi:MAG: hypothetical protein K0S81_1320 [Rhodospirillales bacterium]|jgi:hypothetical protein|nr:hypothetical protein [Rhodospirillales bacterium]
MPRAGREAGGAAAISRRLGRGLTAPVGALHWFHLDGLRIHLFEFDTSQALPRRAAAAQMRRAGP